MLFGAFINKVVRLPDEVDRMAQTQSAMRNGAAAAALLAAGIGSFALNLLTILATATAESPPRGGVPEVQLWAGDGTGELASRFQSPIREAQP